MAFKAFKTEPATAITRTTLRHQAAPQTQEEESLWFFSAADTSAAQTTKPVVIAPQIIDTLPKLRRLIKRLQTCTNPEVPVAWDTETTSLEPHDAQLVGIGCCWGEAVSDMAYIPLGHTSGGNLDPTQALKALRPMLESAAYPKALQNAKFDRLVLRCQGIKLAGVVFDPMLASYVLNPDDSHNLSALSRKHLNLTAQSYTDLVPKGKTIADLTVPAVAAYCGMDVYTTFLLVPKLRALLEPIPALQRLLLDVEQPLEPVLADMEGCGVRVDVDYLKALSQRLETDLAAIELRAYEVAGQQFNLGSPKQLSDLLFNTLGLDTKKSRRMKTGFSTDAATLEALQGSHPVIDAILEQRTLNKLKTTYVDALPTMVHPKTQRVHTNFNQAVTSTGRLSSSQPNLQNVPIRTALSRQIRQAFLPQADWVMVTADYSQIELRLLAHLSQEPILLKTYRENGDIHTLTAQLLLEKDNISDKERRLAKIINFGVIYGMGAQKFAREAGVTLQQARLFIKRFNDRYPQVFAYLQQQQRKAIAQGYVETILGRRRYFNFASEALRQLSGRHPDQINLDQNREHGNHDAGLLRAAANAPIQGSNADIIKIAMVKLHSLLHSYQTRLLLQVHDELVFEIPASEWDALKPKIKDTMETAVALSVPLVVDFHEGTSWLKTD